MTADTVLGLVEWLREQLGIDEWWARAASRDGDDGQTETGEHWRWYDNDTDQLLKPDPGQEEIVGGEAGVQVSLRSTEEYPSRSVGPLPHFALPHAGEVPSAVGGHIARWDPAQVLAEVEAKREILERASRRRLDAGPGSSGEQYTHVLRALAQPYVGRPGWRAEWAAEETTG